MTDSHAHCTQVSQLIEMLTDYLYLSMQLNTEQSTVVRGSFMFKYEQKTWVCVCLSVLSLTYEVEKTAYNFCPTLSRSELLYLDGITLKMLLKQKRTLSLVFGVKTLLFV